jgi:hypothetical protein
MTTTARYKGTGVATELDAFAERVAVGVHDGVRRELVHEDAA